MGVNSNPIAQGGAMHIRPTQHSAIKAYQTKQGLRYKVRLRIDRKLREWRRFVLSGFSQRFTGGDNFLHQ